MRVSLGARGAQEWARQRSGSAAARDGARQERMRPVSGVPLPPHPTRCQRYIYSKLHHTCFTRGANTFSDLGPRCLRPLAARRGAFNALRCRGALDALQGRGALDALQRRGALERRGALDALQRRGALDAPRRRQPRGWET